MEPKPNLSDNTEPQPAGGSMPELMPGQVYAPASQPPVPAGSEPAAAVPLPDIPAGARPTAVVFPQQNSTIINGQPVVSPPAGSSLPPKAPKSRHLLHKALILPAVILLVLLGGSAAAYFGYVIPNKPQNILAKAVSNSLSQHQFTTKGTFNLTDNDVSGKLEYEVAVDEDSRSTDAKINATISGVNIPLEVISTKGSVYFKVGDLSSLYGLLNQFTGSGSDLQQLETQLNKAVTNQWFSVDSTLIKEAKLDCLTAYPAPLTSADVNSLTSSYKKTPFVTVGSHSADTVDGAAATKYGLSIDDDTFARLDLTSTGYFKGLQDCLQKSEPSAKLDLSSIKDGDKTPLTLWVDKKTKQITKYASQSTAKDKSQKVTGDLTGTISYGNVSIAQPPNAKPVLSLLNQLNLSDLTNSFGGGQAAGSAADTERKTDINALVGQTEAFYADNGYYPSLAQLNDSSWLKANMAGLDMEALKDPAGKSAALSASPAAHVYAYQATPAGCDNKKIKCTDYTLTATLDTGSPYAKQSLNSDSALPSVVN